MTFIVVHDNLVRAASDIRDEVAPLEGWSPMSMCYMAEVYGHQELASWMDTVVQAVESGAEELHDAMTDIAGALDYVAGYFAETDEQVAMCYATDPITALGLPEGFDPGPPRIGPATTQPGR